MFLRDEFRLQEFDDSSQQVVTRNMINHQEISKDQMHPSKNHSLQQEHHHFRKPSGAAFPAAHHADADVLELSLSVNIDTRQKGIGGYLWEGKCVSTSHRIFIKPEVESICSTNRIPDFHWLSDDTPIYLEKRDMNPGIEQCNGDLTSNSFDMGRFDLNKALTDDSDSSDHWISDPSTSTSSTVLQNAESSHYEQEFEEADFIVKMGAVSLLDFSLARNIEDCFPNSRKTKGNSNIKTDFSESYESMVLNQPYCNVDEYCTPFTPIEVSWSNEKDYGLKFKRGRRMKDFRKEILPGMGSLSKQEISEDVQIMELALRSREYKKYRSKMNTNRSDSSSGKSRKTR